MRITPRFIAFGIALVFVAAPHVLAQAKNTTPATPAATQAAPAPAQTPAAAKPATPPPAPSQPATVAAPAPAPQGTGGTVAPVAPAVTVPAGPQLEPQGYTYNPEGRRDPFVSLLRRGTDAQRPTLGTRPAGLAGLETSEVTLKGTLMTQGSYVGIVQGSDNKTYIVKAGDKLLDGAITAITPDSMVITQQVTDPLSLEKQREVRKVLRSTEEAK
jgi:Tfp pilus assembly protein PilP